MGLEFNETTIRHLVELAGQKDTYPGGSSRDREAFERYIRSKTIKQKNGVAVRVAESFSTCWYAKTLNLRKAENRLLSACYGTCTYNTHKQSNLQEVDGYVYVLLP